VRLDDGGGLCEGRAGTVKTADQIVTGRRQTRVHAHTSHCGQHTADFISQNGACGVVFYTKPTFEEVADALRLQVREASLLRVDPPPQLPSPAPPRCSSARRKSRNVCACPTVGYAHPKTSPHRVSVLEGARDGAAAGGLRPGMPKSRSSALLRGPSQIAECLDDRLAGNPHPRRSPSNFCTRVSVSEAQGVGLPLADPVREWTDARSLQKNQIPKISTVDFISRKS
jgi:hypothetical protein